jgi:P-type E1-E2 ATPase
VRDLSPVQNLCLRLAALRLGAQEGVLIRNAEAIEIMEKVTIVVVDKTGTLTEGKPRLAQVLPIKGVPEDDLLFGAASVEQKSEHPLAAAIVLASVFTIYTFQRSRLQFWEITLLNESPPYAIAPKTENF